MAVKINKYFDIVTFFVAPKYITINCFGLTPVLIHGNVFITVLTKEEKKFPILQIYNFLTMEEHTTKVPKFSTDVVFLQILVDTMYIQYCKKKIIRILKQNIHIQRIVLWIIADILTC
uniref:Uncharacterized protein n=1 Tax=Octopus bimaculoides TaxID=37653 RepID=A0A0L8G290_OCTBM